MKLRTGLKSAAIALAFICLSPLTKAQPGGGGGDPDPGTSVPFDLGISAMVAAGIGLAAKKKYDLKKKEEKRIEEENK